MVDGAWAREVFGAAGGDAQLGLLRYVEKTSMVVWWMDGYVYSRIN